LLGVLRMRNDQRLTPAERVRSERLLDSHLQTAGNNKRCRAIDTRIEHLSNVFDALEVDTYNAYLLTCLEEEQSLKSLYQGGRVPEALVEEIRTCKADLEQIIGNLYAPDRPTSSSDVISLAQGLLNTPFEGQITPIVDRLKTVLKRVLTQECRNLRKRKVELMRDGHFEEEAYAITDRVDVIVKALRKGWFANQS